MTSDFDDLARAAWSQMWQVTIVVLIIGAIARVCCRNRPRLAYALWMLVVIKAIVPPYWRLDSTTLIESANAAVRMVMLPVSKSSKRIVAGDRPLS